MSNRQLIQIAKILSNLFSPFYAPMWAFVWMFYFSYLEMLPFSYKLFILTLVWITTVLIPRFGINIFRIFMNWTHLQLSHREHRHLPYIVTVCSYSTCLVIMTKLNVPMFIRGIVLTALVSQIICTLINAWWKVSTHMVGMGGLVGALIAFSMLFYFNPVFLLCLLLILSGLVGTARIILRQHTLAQVYTGFLIGFVCALTFVMISWFPS